MKLTQKKGMKQQNKHSRKVETLFGLSRFILVISIMRGIRFGIERGYWIFTLNEPTKSKESTTSKNGSAPGVRIPFTILSGSVFPLISQSCGIRNGCFCWVDMSFVAWKFGWTMICTWRLKWGFGFRVNLITLTHAGDWNGRNCTAPYPPIILCFLSKLSLSLILGWR